MARELQDINSSGELDDIKLTAAQEANKLLQKQEIDAGLALKENKLSNPATDGDVLTATTAGVKSWTTKVGEAPSDGQEYVRKSDSWAVNSGGTGVSEAPEDGSPYSREDAAWVEAPLKSDVTTNKAGISTNAGDISTNAGDIATNTSDIGDNATAIAGKLDDVYGGTGIQINKGDPTNPVISATGSTTAGTLNRVYFTGDVAILASGTYYRTSGAGKGTVAEVLQVETVNDDEKLYFAQDLIGGAETGDYEVPIGDYTAILNSSNSDDRALREYTIELYVTQEDGTPVDSPDITSPIGDLSVRVLAILSSGTLSVGDATVEHLYLSGHIGNPVLLTTGQRVRYHVSVEKIGTEGGAIDVSLYYGSDYNTYLEAPVPVTTDTVINESTVVGATATDALNALETQKADITYVDSQDATKEDALGNPASDGQVLSSTTGGTRSWRDSGGGLPAGGTEGQILTKLSDVEEDADWEDNAALPIGIYTPQLTAYVISGNTGVVEQSYNASVVKATTGQYNVTFENEIAWPYLAVTGAVTDATPSTPQDHHVTIDKATSTGFRMTLFDGTSPVDDGGWSVMIYGADPVPKEISFFSGHSSDDAAYYTKTSELYAVGINSDGILGSGSGNNLTTYQLVLSRPIVDIITTDADSTVAIDSGGGVYRTGQIGFGNEIFSWQTTLSAGAVKWAGDSERLHFVKDDNTLWFVGYQGSSGLSGDGTTTSYFSSPTSITSDVDFVGGNNAVRFIIKTTNNTLQGTGAGSFGALGQGNTDKSLVFIDILTDIDKSKSTILGYYSIVIRLNGDLYAWGRNYNGGLGLGGTTDVLTPTLSNTDVKLIYQPTTEDIAIEVATYSGSGEGTDSGNKKFMVKNTGSVWTTDATGWVDLNLDNATHLTSNYALMPNGDLLKTIDGSLSIAGVSRLLTDSHIIMNDGRTMAIGENTYGQLGVGYEGAVTVWTETTTSLPIGVIAEYRGAVNAFSKGTILYSAGRNTTYGYAGGSNLAVNKLNFSPI